MRNISRLHYITTTAAMAEQACKAGIDWIQLRLKNASHEEFKNTAIDVQKICKRYGAMFIINDNVQLAVEINADGVHIGKEDMPPSQVRKLLGNNFIIGCSTNTINDVMGLANEIIDYIGLGPYRFTSTKEKLNPVLELSGFKSIIQQLHTSKRNIPPLIAIGGIKADDIPGLLKASVHGVAVSSAISNAADIGSAAQSFLQTIHNQSHVETQNFASLP